MEKLFNAVWQEISVKLDRRFTNNLVFTFILLLFAILEGYLLVSALETGMRKTLNIVILIPLIILAIAFFPRIRIQTLVGFLLLLFWIPAGFDNWSLYIFEIFLYVILILLILKFDHSKDEDIRHHLTNIPWIPFFLYILGALLTWFLSNRVGGELNEIRAMCVIPLALSMVIFLAIRSTDDAEYLLWMILTAAAVLGLLFLVAKNFSGFISLSDYAVGSGRLSMTLSIPYVGSLSMLPQSTSNWFGYLLVFAYSIWIFHPSLMHRTYALFLCLLFGLITITTQGRGGALTAALGALIVSIYATFNSRLFGIKGVWIKFVFVSLVVIGGLWYLATHSANAGFYEHGTVLFTSPQRDATLLGRFQMWSKGIGLFLENPIFGIGLSGIETPWGPDTSEILNYFLLNLLGYGLLGFIGIMLILFKLLVTFWKGIQMGNRNIRMMCIASISGMFGFFLGLQPEEPYSTVLVWAPLLITFAITTLEGNWLVKDDSLVSALNEMGG
jgi:O-antigen ligase